MGYWAVSATWGDRVNRFELFDRALRGRTDLALPLRAGTRRYPHPLGRVIRHPPKLGLRLRDLRWALGEPPRTWGGGKIGPLLTQGYRKHLKTRAVWGLQRRRPPTYPPLNQTQYSTGPVLRVQTGPTPRRPHPVRLLVARTSCFDAQYGGWAQGRGYGSAVRNLQTRATTPCARTNRHHRACYIRFINAQRGAKYTHPRVRTLAVAAGIPQRMYALRSRRALPEVRHLPPASWLGQASRYRRTSAAQARREGGY